MDTEVELLNWQAALGSLDVEHTHIASANSIPGASVLVFRDPDNIQLELFFDPTTG